jgi:hypothetical protein
VQGCWETSSQGQRSRIWKVCFLHFDYIGVDAFLCFLTLHNVVTTTIVVVIVVVVVVVVVVVAVDVVVAVAAASAAIVMMMMLLMMMLLLIVLLLLLQLLLSTTSHDAQNKRVHALSFNAAPHSKFQHPYSFLIPFSSSSSKKN